MTVLVHGQAEFEKVLEVTKILHKGGNVREASEETLTTLFESFESHTIILYNPVSLVDLLIKLEKRQYLNLHVSGEFKICKPFQ